MDITLIAQSVSQWPTKTKALTEAINLFDEVGYQEYVAVVPNPDTINVKNLPDVLKTYASERVVEAVWNESKKDIRFALARKVLRVAADSVDAIFKAEQSAFDEAVAVFTENVSLLPEQIDPVALVNSGGKTVDAYGVAVEANKILEKYAGWIGSLKNLPVYAVGEYHPALAILQPESRNEYQYLLDVRATDSALNDQFVYAVRNGIKFGMNTPAEISALITRFNNEPATSRFPGFTRMEDVGNGVQQLVKADGSSL